MKLHDGHKWLMLGLAIVVLTLLSGCATIDNYYEKTIYSITEAECKMFNSDQFGKCMREHYPRVEEDYSWESKKE